LYIYKKKIYIFLYFNKFLHLLFLYVLFSLVIIFFKIKFNK
jgi:hypothetical protein